VSINFVILVYFVWVRGGEWHGIKFSEIQWNGIEL